MTESCSPFLEGCMNDLASREIYLIGGRFDYSR
jgi:hypothetical protein